MRRFWKKLPRLVKILVEIVGVLVGLTLVLVLGFKIWTLTWKTYENGDFGFSFKYPSNWYIGGTSITKAQLNQKNVVYFWVDSQSPTVVGSGTDLKRSAGSVVVNLEKNTSFTIIDARVQQGSFSKYIKGNFGNEVGYIYDGVGRTPEDLGSLFVFSKELLLKTNDYTFSGDTLTYSDSTDVFAQIKARFYHLIGSAILDSFYFSK